MAHEFKAEIKELMNLIVNSFYSDKDIFLRELISNASDAINKTECKEPSIKIKSHPESNILTIQDNGIGMDRNDMQNNLGKIAHSGTKTFVESLKSTNETKLIGQFGVGFYSAFLVADIVKVYSSKDGEKCYCWESDIRNSKHYKITASDELKEIGTKIELHVRDKDSVYLNNKKLKNIINKHSLYIVHPILLHEDNEFKQLNKEKSLWSRLPSTVNQNEYLVFYRNFINNQSSNYLDVKHFHVEGNMNLQGVLYVPTGKEQFNPYNITREDKNKRNNIKIYSNNVFIMDRCEDFVPHWLSFIRGVIDSSDLPLNVSREILQKGRSLEFIESTFIKKTLELFDNIYDDERKMDVFYTNYSKNIKMGINKTNKYSQKLLKYLRYHSNTSGTNLRSLDEYIKDMRFAQKGIYYITGSSIDQIVKSPYLESFNDKGIEVLFMDDPFDECMMQYLQQYKGKHFISICKEKSDLYKIDKKTKKEYQPLCDAIYNILCDRIEKVTLSTRIVETPVCLIAAEKGWSANMERIMISREMRSGGNIQFKKTKKILEINPNNPIIKNIKDTLENSSEKDIINIVHLLYDLSCFHSGYQLDNAADFSEKMYNMIEMGLGLSQDDNEEVNVL